MKRLQSWLAALAFVTVVLVGGGATDGHWPDPFVNGLENDRPICTDRLGSGPECPVFPPLQ